MAPKIERRLPQRIPIEIGARARIARTPRAQVAPAIRRAAITDLPQTILTPVRGNAARQGPYADYARHLTDEGGVLISYKDLDLRFRHTVVRVLLWSAFTGFAYWHLFQMLTLESWQAYAALGLDGLANWLIVRWPIEVYRSIEIRQDCMVLDGTDLFWLSQMENGWPTFRPGEEDSQVLCGNYGTRYVEYATVRRFNENDRTPDVLKAHLEEAMNQLWGRLG